MAELIVTIDGPAASGKSTVARLLAEKLCAGFLDTGAMYRAVAFAAMQSGVDVSDEDELLGVLNDTQFHFGFEKNNMTVHISGVDVIEEIRQPEVTANARYVASAEKLRGRLVQMQREYARPRKKIVSEGRDQGTVAFPDADVKFFLTADVAERAARRYRELREKGIEQSLEQTQLAIEERDKSDQTREVGPLKPADDAIIVDTTNLTVNEVVTELLGWVEKKCSKSG